MRNLIAELEAVGIDVLWTFPVSTDWRKHQNSIRKKPKVDAFIVNGEGTIHRANERKFAMALVSLAEFAEKELSTPSYLINSTLHKNPDSAYQLLSHYRAIYVRDQRSLNELNQAGLKGAYVPDLTFAGQGLSLPLGKLKGCVIDSAIKEDTAKLKLYAEQQGFDFRSMIVARPENAKFLRSPRPYVKNVYRWLSGEYKVSTDPDSYIQYLKQHQLVVTGRYHTVTMCIKNEIPFVALESNTPKVNSLLNDVFGHSDRSLTLEQIESSDLSNGLAFSEADTHAMRSFCQSARDNIHSMIADIKADIESPRTTDFDYAESP